MTVKKVKLTDLEEEIHEEFETELNNNELAIITRSKAKVEQEFVLMFVQNIQSVVDILTKNEFKTLLSIVKYSQYKNVFSINQEKIAKDSAISQPAVSSAMKKLREKSFILENDGVEYVNPYLFIKGGLVALKQDKNGVMKAVKQQQDLFSNIEKSFWAWYLRVFYYDKYIRFWSCMVLINIKIWGLFFLLSIVNR